MCVVLLLALALAAAAPAAAANPQDTIGVQQIKQVTVNAPRTPTSYKQDKITLNLALIDQTISTTALPDPIAVLQLMPGVQTTGEVNSGLYVRGCNTSQNLILFDQASIYNPSHLMGLFSVFNTPTLDQITLHKSYLSPQYSSRIGGALDVQSKGQVPLSSSFRGDVGLISSSFAASVKLHDQWAIHAGLRASYINPIINLFTEPNSPLDLNYDFWDANLSAVYTPTHNDRIKLSAYAGSDNLSINSSSFVFDGGIDWSNRTVSLQWDHQSNDSCSRMHALYGSNYDNKIRSSQFDQSFSLPNSIVDGGFKSIWSRKMGRTLVRWGVEGVYHYLIPQAIESSSNALRQRSEPSSSIEGKLWAEAAFPLARELELTVGGALSGYYEVGSRSFYGNPEPRANLEWRVSRQSTLSFSVGRMAQYIRQITVSPSGFPTDFWVASNDSIPPLTATALSLGYDLTLGGWNFSAALYYKAIRNEVESTAGLVMMYNQPFNLNHYLHYGSGQNWGLELYAARTLGRFTGSVAYTLGFAPRSFADIDQGRVFEATYNRRHDLSVSLQYHLTKNIWASAVFVLASGNAYTPVSAIYLVGGTPVNEYGPHNSARMPTYHRLDLALSYRFKPKKLRRSMLKLALYNVYGHANPIAKYDFLKYEEQHLYIDTRYVSLYSFVPTIGYTFEF